MRGKDDIGASLCTVDTRLLINYTLPTITSGMMKDMSVCGGVAKEIYQPVLVGKVQKAQLHYNMGV